jgi:hypothetical protein
MEGWALQLIQEHTTLQQDALKMKGIAFREWLPPRVGKVVSSSEDGNIDEYSDLFEEDA